MYQTLKGTVRHGQIEFVEALALPENAVVLVTILETPPAPQASPKPHWETVLAEIHARQKARGHVPPTPEELLGPYGGEEWAKRVQKLGL